MWGSTLHCILNHALPPGHTGYCVPKLSLLKPFVGSGESHWIWAPLCHFGGVWGSPNLYTYILPFS